MITKRNYWFFLLCCTATLNSWGADPYETYVRKSKDFQSVHQDADWALKAFPGWLYMPWTFRWGIGYSDASGVWSREHGYNGAFIDHGNVGLPGAPTGRLDWIEKHRLPFYVDHAAGKGWLHLWDGDKVKSHLDELHGTGVRPVPLNDATRVKLESVIDKNLASVKKSPMRAAYALDDEVSWGHFVHPTMWQVTDDQASYDRWLQEIYGKEAAPHRQSWVSYEDIRKQLTSWSIAEFDASPLMDQWTFNDSCWSNFLGELVTYTNRLDPETPCGVVGGQMPSPFGGFDYAKLMRKVQFIESYNLGSSQAIIRSFNPKNALSSVTTHFHRSVEDSIWQTWYYLAHGNRGHIGWVDGWFDGESPKSWHSEVASTYREAGSMVGPMMRGAQWEHDGVAIYYNHASIQLGWILDAEGHGKTWINRNNDERLSSAALVRRAWENMLRDANIQYNFVSYADVIRDGVPSEYRVLILPACLCLSDAESRQIEDFCRRGGTVIADYLPGLWDQHGRGRAGGGALDAMFGVVHKSSLRAPDIFGERLWVETDQDANYSYRSYEELLTNKNTSILDRSGFHRAVREMPVESSREVGSGRAVLMNLSPQWYQAYRTSGAAAAKKRDVFMKHVLEAGVKPRVQVVGEADAIHGSEVTYWNLPTGRRLVFLVGNPETRGTSTGGGNSVGLKSGTVSIELRFAKPAVGVRDERNNKELGDGSTFILPWKMNEAIVLSMAGD